MVSPPGPRHSFLQLSVALAQSLPEIIYGQRELPHSRLISPYRQLISIASIQGNYEVWMNSKALYGINEDFLQIASQRIFSLCPLILPSVPHR